MRDNGAIEGAADGFEADDEVIVMQHKDLDIIKVIGHIDGVRHCGGYIIYTITRIGGQSYPPLCIVWQVKKGEAKSWDSGFITLSTAEDFVAWKAERTNLAKILFTGGMYDDAGVPPYVYYFEPETGVYGHDNNRGFNGIFPLSVFYSSLLNIAGQKPGFRTAWDLTVPYITGTIFYAVYVNEQRWWGWNGDRYTGQSTVVTVIQEPDSIANPIYQEQSQIEAAVRARYPEDIMSPNGPDHYKCTVNWLGGQFFKVTNSITYRFYDVLGFICAVPTTIYREQGPYGAEALRMEYDICKSNQLLPAEAPPDKKAVYEQLSFSQTQYGAYTDSIISHVSIVQIRPHSRVFTGGNDINGQDTPDSDFYTLEPRILHVNAMAHHDPDKTIETDEFDWSTMTSRNSTLAGLIRDAILELYNGSDIVNHIGVSIEIY